MTPDVKDFEPQVDVTFRIDEGDRIKSTRCCSKETATQPTANSFREWRHQFQPGKPYSPHLLELDRNRILAVYLDHGYLNADFKVQRSTPSLETRIFSMWSTQIQEGPQGRVSEVVVLGEKVTRTRFISVTAPDVGPEKPLSQGKFFTAEERSLQPEHFRLGERQAARAALANRPREKC